MSNQKSSMEKLTPNPNHTKRRWQNDAEQVTESANWSFIQTFFAADKNFEYSLSIKNKTTLIVMVFKIKKQSN